jgi:integrase
MIWAWKRRLIEFAPPIERPSKPKPKERHLTRAEAERLLASATMPHIRGAIILLLTTAARVGAILDLTWDRVDLDRKFIRLALPDAGTRKGRATVPINNAAMAVLQELRKGALTNNVIEWRGEPVLSIKTGFYAAAKAADLPGVSPHVLRHTQRYGWPRAASTWKRSRSTLGTRTAASPGASMPASPPRTSPRPPRLWSSGALP